MCNVWEWCCEAPSMDWLCPSHLHLFPQISPRDGIRDPQPGRPSHCLLVFLAVSNAEAWFVQETDQFGLIFIEAL